MKDKEKLPTEKQIAIYDMLDAKCTVTDEGVQGFLTWKQIRDVYNSIVEEPVSEELENEIEKYLKDSLSVKFPTTDIKSIKSDVRYIARHFVNWQKEQFEKNRLAHCEALTEEQAQIESDFVTQHLKENNRTPTFIDAIEHGMRLQKEQMMKDATEAYIRRNRYTKQNVLNGFDVTCDAIQKFNGGDKVKVIVTKEG